MNAQKALIDMGIQSKQGASQVLGIEYEETQQEIADTKASEKTLGQNLLDQFMRTGSVTPQENVATPNKLK